MTTILRTVLLALIIFSGELVSQPGGTLTGIVTAANKMPVAQARVRVVGTNLATVTRVDGTFEVAQVPAGRQKLEVVMIGYTPTAIAIEIAAGAPLDVNVVL